MGNCHSFPCFVWRIISSSAFLGGGRDRILSSLSRQAFHVLRVSAVCLDSSIGPVNIPMGIPLLRSMVLFSSFLDPFCLRSLALFWRKATCSIDRSVCSVLSKLVCFVLESGLSTFMQGWRKFTFAVAGGGGKYIHFWEIRENLLILTKKKGHQTFGLETN